MYGNAAPTHYDGVGVWIFRLVPQCFFKSDQVSRVKQWNQQVCVTVLLSKGRGPVTMVRLVVWAMASPICQPGCTQVNYNQQQKPGGCVFCPTDFPKAWFQFKSVRSPQVGHWRRRAEPPPLTFLYLAPCLPSDHVILSSGFPCFSCKSIFYRNISFSFECFLFAART